MRLAPNIENLIFDAAERFMEVDDEDDLELPDPHQIKPFETAWR